MYSCTKVPYSMYPYSMYPENVSGRSRDLLLVFSLYSWVHYESGFGVPANPSATKILLTV